MESQLITTKLRSWRVSWRSFRICSEK